MKLFSHLAFMLFALSVYSQTAVVISENANLRGTPSENGKIVDTIGRDTQVEILKQKSSWFLVQSTEYVGWIHGNTIRLTADGGNTTVTERVIQTTVPEPRTIYIPRANTQPRTSGSRTYYRGPRGGCYYINSSGKKTYVDHSLCN